LISSVTDIILITLPVFILLGLLGLRIRWGFPPLYLAQMNSWLERRVRKSFVVYESWLLSENLAKRLTAKLLLFPTAFMIKSRSLPERTSHRIDLTRKILILTLPIGYLMLVLRYFNAV
jgi:hypothetical protein